MKLDYVPLLPDQRDLQRIPLGRARFQHYLRLIFSKAPDVVERGPLVAANPMAKEHVTELLDAYLALDADRIAAEAAREAAAALADVPGERYASLIIMDDLLGGGTNPYAEEFTCLFGDAPARTLGFTPQGLSPWAGLALALHDARL